MNPVEQVVCALILSAAADIIRHGKTPPPGLTVGELICWMLTYNTACAVFDQYAAYRLTQSWVAKTYMG